MPSGQSRANRIDALARQVDAIKQKDPVGDANRIARQDPDIAQIAQKQSTETDRAGPQHITAQALGQRDHGGPDLQTCN